jgi:hypothetical protein
MHTFLLDGFTISPRLGIRSPTKGCGKTTLLDVLGRLVLRPLPTSNVTTAAIFRVVEGCRPTLLTDEGDTFLRDNDELRGVLNSGHRKGGTVLRTVGDDHEPRAFSTYSACAIALIGELPDTLHDRSIAVDLKRRLPSEQVEPFRSDRTDYLDLLARQVARWAGDHSDAITAADPDMPAGIINREADNWRPLLAIADTAGGGWPKRARDAAMAAHAARAGDDQSRIEMLLADIKEVCKGKIEVTSSELVNRLVALEGRPWAEMGNSGRSLTQNRLARMLKPLGIAPGQVGPEAARLRGYRTEQFEDAFVRFLPPEGVSNGPSVRNAVNTGTSRNFKVSSQDDGRTVEKCKKSNNDGVSDTWTVAKGGNGHTSPKNDMETTVRRHRDDTAGPLGNDRSGPFLDADGRPTGDPEEGYYGRKAREQIEDAPTDDGVFDIPGSDDDIPGSDDGIPDFLRRTPTAPGGEGPRPHSPDSLSVGSPEFERRCKRFARMRDRLFTKHEDDNKVVELLRAQISGVFPPELVDSAFDRVMDL